MVVLQPATELAHLYEPTKVSRSRIKRLRGLSRPQYRLRVDEFRVFYDVMGDEIHVLAIVSKSHADVWLAEEGQSAEDSRSLGSEG